MELLKDLPKHRLIEGLTGPTTAYYYRFQEKTILLLGEIHEDLKEIEEIKKSKKSKKFNDIHKWLFNILSENVCIDLLVEDANINNKIKDKTERKTANKPERDNILTNQAIEQKIKEIEGD